MGIRLLGHVPNLESPDRPADAVISVKIAEKYRLERLDATVSAKSPQACRIEVRYPSYHDILSTLATMPQVPLDEKTRFCAFLEKRNRREAKLRQLRQVEEDAGSDASASETEEPPLAAKFASLPSEQQEQFPFQGLFA